MDRAEGEVPSRNAKAHRWRQKTRRLKKLTFQPSLASEQDVVTAVEGADSKSSQASPALKQVQIVDLEMHMEGLRPYTLYVILTKRGGGGKLIL